MKRFNEMQNVGRHMTSPFAVTYAPELAQYVVERGEMRVVPTARKLIDADAHERATTLCVALNRVYAAPRALTPALAHREDGSPRDTNNWLADGGADFAQPDMPDLPDIANDVCGWCGSDATACDCEERYV